MNPVICMVTILGLVLQTQSTLPPCSGLMRYSEKAIEFIFQTQMFQLQDVLSNATVKGGFPAVPLDITEINIQRGEILEITSQLLPRFGVQVSVNADLHLFTKVAHQPVDLRVLADIISKVQILQDFSGNPKLSITTCEAKLKEFQVTQTTHSQETLKGQIAIILNNKLCLIFSDVLLGLNVQLGEFVGLINFGPQTQIKYFLSSSPTVTSHHIQFGVNVELYLLGKVLGTSAHRVCVPLPLQPNSDISEYSLMVHEDSFNIVFNAMVWAGAFNFGISGGKHGGVNQLTTEKLRSVNHEIPEMYPENYPIVLKVGVSKTPRITLAEEMIILHLQPSVELIVMMPNEGPYKSLIMLSMDVQLKVDVKITENKLRTESVQLRRKVKLALETSAVGPINIEILETIIAPLLEDALLFHYKGALGVGWTLPNLFNLELLNASLSIHEGYAVVSGNLAFPL